MCTQLVLCYTPDVWLAVPGHRAADPPASLLQIIDHITTYWLLAVRMPLMGEVQRLKPILCHNAAPIPLEYDSEAFQYVRRRLVLCAAFKVHSDRIHTLTGFYDVQTALMAVAR